MRLVAFSAAIFVAICGSAFAQPSINGENNGENLDQSKSAQSTNTAPVLSEKVKSDLAQAGFSDLQVVPRSFLLRVKDKDGQRVMMLVRENAIMGIAGLPDEDEETTGSGASSGADSSSGQGANPDTGASPAPGANGSPGEGK